MNARSDKASTNWVAIWALFLSGCTLAVHVGKFPAALPLLVSEFNLSLAQSGNLVSIYALLIAFGALLVGVTVARVGYVPFAIAGVGLCMLGSLFGSFATSVPMLLVGRAVEGLGWLMGVVSLPALVSTLAAKKDLPVVMGLWGAFMPIGASFMLFLAPILQPLGGWRLSWAVTTALSLLAVITVVVICRAQREILQPLSHENSVGELEDLYSRESFAALVCFMCYSFQYVAVTAFLPILLVQDSGMTLAHASYWAALVMLANAVGNLASGWLIKLGLKQHHILACASIVMGITAWIALSVPDTAVRITAAIMMTAISGVIPGTLFSTATVLASSAAGVGIIIGFMLTGTGLGQLLGPVALTRVVEWSSHWYVGGIMCLGVGVLGALFAMWLRHLPAAGD